MRKITSLLMLFCMCVGMAWGQILTTSPTAGKSYTLKCKATDHVGFIGDNGTIVHGRSAAPTGFVFEAAEGVENGFYIKSEVSGKYLYAEGDKNSNVVLSSENKTIWVVNAPAHSAGYVSLAAHGKTNLYLNNNGGTNNLKLNEHGSGPGSDNACSLWQLRTSSINVGAGKYYRIINKANANKTITDQESNVLTTKDRDVNNDQQIWYVQGDNYQGYTLKSIFSNRYFNYVDANYTHWGTAQNTVKFYIGKVEEGYFHLSFNETAKPEDLASAHYSNGNIVRWRWADKSGENYTNVNPSLWQFEEVDASVVNEILDGRYSALTNFIEGEKTRANETLEAAGFSFNPFPLTTGNTTCPAEYNALSGGTDGGGVAALLDDDDNTFMHTDYSSKYFEPHYIQVDLGEGTTSKYITFSYRARHNNHNNNPETMIIKGSVDGTTYEDITTLTNLPDGLVEYESNVIGNGKAYRYFRFVVTATTNNDSRNGHVFFSLAKFRLNLVNVNETYAQKVNVLLNFKNAIEFEQPAERPADWYPMLSKNFYNELQDFFYGVTIREYPFTLTTDVNNPVCYQILSGRATQNNGTPYYFTLKPNNGGGKVKLESTTQNDIYSYWFFMEEPATGMLMIVPFMEENKPLGYVTVEDGISKLTNVHSTENFAGYYFEVIEYAGVNGFPYAFKPYKATTNVSNYGGTDNFMGFYNGGSDGGTAVKFEAKDCPSLLYRQLPAAIASANTGCPGNDITGDMLNGYTAASVEDYKAEVAKAEGLYGKASETTDEEITAQKNTLANLYHDVLVINLPKDGKFYRVRCADEDTGKRRLQSTIKNDRLQMISGETGINVNSIFCYVDGGLLSYTVGKYINAYRFNEVGNNSVVAFSKAYNGVLGQYNIKINDERYIYGKKDEIDSGTDTPSDQGYNWWLEEVKEIPVTIGTAGASTLYAPVALSLPTTLSEGQELTVYTAVQNDEYLTLTPVESVIPANTGVILRGTAGTYNFTISDDASAPVGQLKGTVATKVNPNDGSIYTLQKPADAFVMKKYNGTNLNGFKAYYEMSGNSNVQTLRLSFGDPTGIETVVNGNENGKLEIYDMSGRRVEKMTKGLYIVNGQKVLVK